MLFHTSICSFVKHCVSMPPWRRPCVWLPKMTYYPSTNLLQTAKVLCTLESGSFRRKIWYEFTYSSPSRVCKGQTIQIPILALNRSKEIWGEDAREFKYVFISIFFRTRPIATNRPERWESAPEAAASIPGVWGHMLTFIGGPRACIGYRFSLVE